MAVLGPVGANEVILGYNYPVQVVTLGSSPTRGSFYLSEPGRPENVTTSIAYNASSSSVQTAVRAVAAWSQATVTGNSGGPWTVTLNSDRATYSVLDVVNSTVEGSSGAVDITVTGSPVPLNYWVQTPVRTATVAPLAGKTIIAGSSSATERTAQVKASEYITQAPIYLGRRTLKEQEDASRYWDGDMTTFVPEMFTLPLGSIGTRYNGVTGSLYSTINTAKSLVYARKPVATTGGLFSITRNYAGLETVTTLGNFSSSLPSEYGDLTWFGTTLYCTGNSNTENYYTWDGSTWTSVNMGDTSAVVSFETLGDRLFSLNLAGQVRYTVATTAGASDWTTITTLKYKGDGFPLKLKRWKDPATGNAAIVLAASDGIYLVDETGSGTVRLLGDLKMSIGMYATSATGYITNQVIDVKDGNLIFISGNSVKSYNGSTVSDIGPSIQDGLPLNGTFFNQYYLLHTLVATRQWILVGGAIVNAYATTSTPIPSDTNHIVLGYQDGWHVINQQANKGYGRALAVSSDWTIPFIYDDYGTQPFNDTVGNAERSLKGAYYKSSGTLTTAWYDRGLPDIPKTFWGGTVEVKDVTDTARFTIEYQLDNLRDNEVSSMSTDPRRGWKPCLDASGSSFATTSTLLNGTSGTLNFYFDRPLAADGVTRMSRGVVSKAIRFRITAYQENGSVTDLATTNASKTITSSTGVFKPSDVGKLISIDFSPTVYSVITAVTNANTATMETAATSTASNKTITIYRTPVLTTMSVANDAKFDRVHSFPLALNLEHNGGLAPDGRTTDRQTIDLHAALDYRAALPFAYRSGEGYLVTVDSLTFTGGSSGLNSTQGVEPLIAGVTVSERVQTR